MIKRAILTGEKENLQEFIYEWYKNETGEVPQIDEDMDIVLPVKKEHERPIKSMASAFELHCYIVETEK